MKYILIIFTFFLFSCTKQKQHCYSLSEFFNSDPIELKNVESIELKDVSCNVYTMNVKYYDGKRERIYMDYWHRIIKKISGQ